MADKKLIPNVIRRASIKDRNQTLLNRQPKVQEIIQ
jgi:hypothetical protein